MKKTIKDKSVHNGRSRRKRRPARRPSDRPDSPLDRIAKWLGETHPGEPNADVIGQNLPKLLNGLLDIARTTTSEHRCVSVVAKAVEMTEGECGMLMLLDSAGELRVRSVHNIDYPREPELPDVWDSLASQVLTEGRSTFVADTVSNDRYAEMPSVTELRLRSALAAPLRVGEQLVGVICIGNPSWAGDEVEMRLCLLEFYADMAAGFINNCLKCDDLRRQAEEWATVLSQSPVGIVVIDNRGGLVTTNPAALEVFDLDRDKVRTAHAGPERQIFTDLLQETERARWHYMITSALTFNENYSNDRYYHYTGYVEKVLSVKFSPLSGGSDGEQGLMVMVEDVTEKVKTEEYLVLSEKLAARGELASSIAHQLNNYLAVTSNNAELLRLNVEREKWDAARGNSEAIVDNIFQIKEVVESLVDQSKPQPEYISYDVKRLVEDVLFSLRGSPDFKHIHFTIDLAQDIPNVEMDVEQIQQVLVNVLDNAADAIEEQAIDYQGEGQEFRGKITIRASYDNFSDTVILAISDNGKGMTAETVKKVFDMHFTTKKGGHGLGLHDARKVLGQHGGAVTVESTYDEGSTFTITLPRLQEDSLEEYLE
ncbi:MAG: PAS domain S-box protein [Candidatus Zixiibacteriota bacterium]|nr:MAG: PAS domain S-box protein [candidate division Zixibacteria bacterium]